jgi:dihydropyrimidinase
MLDAVIVNGQVVTPQGSGRWDVGIQGERIAAVAEPGTLARDAARVIDATGKIVVPGGIEPHAHLAHPIMTDPENPSVTLGPEDDTRGMACGGTTTHLDFCYVRPGNTIEQVIETRLHRWKGKSHVDYGFHITLCGAVDFRIFDQVPEAIQQGFPSFKVFTTNVLPPHPKRHGNRIDFGRIHFLMDTVAPLGGLVVVHGEDEDVVQFNYERFRHEGRIGGEHMHLVHSKLSELLAFRRATALARATGCAVYFVHTSAREGVDTIREARAAGQPVYGETLHQYACFNAEHYRQPRGFCAHTYPSLKFPEDQAALWEGLVRDGLSTLATDEYPTTLDFKLRGSTIEDVTGGNTGAEARMGIAWTEGVAKRGMSIERFVEVTSSNAARIFGLYPTKGAIAPGSDADIVLMDPAFRKTLAPEDFHVSDYSPWEGWHVSGWPVLTMLRGSVIAEAGKVLGSLSDGRLLSRKIDAAVRSRPVC